VAPRLNHGRERAPARARRRAFPRAPRTFPRSPASQSASKSSHPRRTLPTGPSAVSVPVRAYRGRGRTTASLWRRVRPGTRGDPPYLSHRAPPCARTPRQPPVAPELRRHPGCRPRRAPISSRSLSQLAPSPHALAPKEATEPPHFFSPAQTSPQWRPQRLPPRCTADGHRRPPLPTELVPKSNPSAP
jgi:hypothetical protein